MPIVKKKTWGVSPEQPPSDLSGGCQPPSDWHDIKAILLNDTTEGYGGKYIQLITDHYDTISLTGALAYKTSDGAFYTANTTHTWDREQDKPCSLGYKTRYIIYYTNESSGVDIQATCLWAVLDVMLSSVATITAKRFLKAFEFVNGKNLSPTLTNASDMFSACTSLTRIPDVLDLANVTNASYMFSACYSLTRIPDVLDLANVTNASSMFASSAFIRNLRLSNLKTSANIAASSFVTRDDLLFTLANLQQVTDETLTIGAANIAKLTIDDITSATSKGWTIA